MCIHTSMLPMADFVPCSSNHVKMNNDAITLLETLWNVITLL